MDCQYRKNREDRHSNALIDSPSCQGVRAIMDASMQSTSIFEIKLP